MINILFWDVKKCSGFPDEIAEYYYDIFFFTLGCARGMGWGYVWKILSNIYLFFSLLGSCYLAKDLLLCF